MSVSFTSMNSTYDYRESTASGYFIARSWDQSLSDAVAVKLGCVLESLRECKKIKTTHAWISSAEFSFNNSGAFRCCPDCPICHQVWYHYIRKWFTNLFPLRAHGSWQGKPFLTAKENKGKYSFQNIAHFILGLYSLLRLLSRNTFLKHLTL